jgi:hypothetical protein
MFRVTVTARFLILMYLIFTTDFKECGVWIWNDIYRYKSTDLPSTGYGCKYSGGLY